MRTYLAPIATLLIILWGPQASWAQNAKWEIEGHVGGAFSTALSGGAATLPAGGDPFTTISGRASQAVSSWYYGDGAALINAVAADIDENMFRFADRVVPLDSLLNDPLAERRNGWSIGGRVAYNFTPRLAAEFSFDYSSSPVVFSDSAMRGLEATSDSFEKTFGTLFYGIRPSDVASTLTIRDHEGAQLAATGTLNVNLLTRGKFIPYVAVGGGVLSNRGDAPVANLEGRYMVNYMERPLFDETDSVTLLHSIGDTAFVGVFGGGIKAFVTERSGLRFDVRVHLAKTTVETLLSADPSIAQVGPGSVWSTYSNPSAQFSSAPWSPYRSSLSRPAVDGFRSLSVSSWQPRVLLSVGYFWRF